MGRQLLIDALQGKETERPAWVPFVGCHGAALIGTDAETYLRSGDLMTRGTVEAIKQYQPDGIPIAFDLQIEAEALGCELQWAQDNPPAVTGHVLAHKNLSDLKIPTEQDGRFPEILKAVRQVKAVELDVGLYGLVTGPFTLALHLLGTQIFMDMFDNPDKVHQLMSFATDVASTCSNMYIDAGCDVIALVDPMTSQISPDAFREFVSPYARRIFDFIRDRQRLSSFFVCGHAQKNVEAMCETGPDNVSIDENIPLDYVKTVCQQHGISFGGNMQLTVVLLMGNEDDARRNAIECMDIGGTTGFILAPGCDLPFAVPPANLKAVAELVRDPYKARVARELLAKQTEVKSKYNLADYGQTSKVVVDIITLDSEACAPCQYMVEAVKAVAPQFDDVVVWREHKIKQRESVEFMMGLMVKNIPTICIDGQIKFVSRIPAQDELIAAIQERINEKFGMQLKMKRSKLLVLGAGCELCEQTWANVKQAHTELGSTIDIEQIHNEQKIFEYGISKTPAVISISQQIKSMGRVPSIEVIKEWLKDLG